MDICLIIISVCLILLLYLKYLEKRNSEVCQFKINMIKKYGVEIEEKTASYHKMLFSFKPLEEKYWIKETFYQNNKKRRLI